MRARPLGSSSSPHPNFKRPAGGPELESLSPPRHQEPSHFSGSLEGPKGLDCRGQSIESNDHGFLNNLSDIFLHRLLSRAWAAGVLTRQQESKHGECTVKGVAHVFS